MCMETEHEHGIKADAKDMKDNRDYYLVMLERTLEETKKVAHMYSEESRAEYLKITREIEAILQPKERDENEHDIPVQEDEEDEDEERELDI